VEEDLSIEGRGVRPVAARIAPVPLLLRHLAASGPLFSGGDLLANDRRDVRGHLFVESLQRAVPSLGTAERNEICQEIIEGLNWAACSAGLRFFQGV